MPSWSKLDFCKFSADWASQDCPCKSDFDDFTTQKPDNFTESSHGLSGDSRGHNEIEDVVEEIRHLRSEGRDDELRSQGVRIPLPWELLQPALRNCLAAHYADAIGPCYGIPNYCDVWVSIYSFLSMLDLFQMVGSCQQSFCKSDNFHFVLGDICI